MWYQTVKTIVGHDYWIKIANSPSKVWFWIVIHQIKGFETPISTRVEPFLGDKNCGNCHHFTCFLLFLVALLFKMPYFLKFYHMKKSYARVNDKLSDVIVWWQTSYMISHEKVWRVNAPLRCIYTSDFFVWYHIWLSFMIIINDNHMWYQTLKTIVGYD